MGIDKFWINVIGGTACGITFKRRDYQLPLNDEIRVLLANVAHMNCLATLVTRTRKVTLSSAVVLPIPEAYHALPWNMMHELRPCVIWEKLGHRLGCWRRWLVLLKLIESRLLSRPLVRVVSASVR
jgi:hypothetical protein